MRGVGGLFVPHADVEALARVEIAGDGAKAGRREGVWLDDHQVVVAGNVVPDRLVEPAVEGDFGIVEARHDDGFAGGLQRQVATRCWRAAFRLGLCRCDGGLWFGGSPSVGGGRCLWRRWHLFGNLLQRRLGVGSVRPVPNRGDPQRLRPPHQGAGFAFVARLRDDAIHASAIGFNRHHPDAKFRMPHQLGAKPLRIAASLEAAKHRGGSERLAA